MIPIALLIVGVGGLYLAAQTPVAPVQERLEAAAADGRLWTQEYPVVSAGMIDVALVDAWSECTSLGQALSESALPFAERPNGQYDPDQGSCKAFNDALIAPLAMFSYPRFYHGASAVIRVALQVMNIEVLRLLVTLALLALIGILCVITWSQSRWLSAGFAVFFLILTDTPYQGLSVSHGISTAVGIAGVIAALVVSRRHPRFVFGTAAAAGVLYALVAQLYVPMEFAVLTAVAVMAMALKLQSERRRWLWTGAAVSVSWIAGYAFAMVVRFVWIALAQGADASAEEGSTAAATRLTSSILQPIRTVVWNLISIQMLEWKVRAIGLMVFIAMAAFLLGYARKWVLAPSEVLIGLIPTGLTALWLQTFGGHNGHGWVVNVLYAVLMNAYFIILLNASVARTHQSRSDVSIE